MELLLQQHHCPGMLSWSCCEVLGDHVEDIALHGPLPLAPVPPDLSLDLHQHHGQCWHPGAPGSTPWRGLGGQGVGKLSLCPHEALEHPQGGPVPTMVPGVGMWTHTHLPVEETVEQSHQEALGRTGRAIFTQRKGLDPSVLIFSLAFPPPTPLTSHRAEEICARFSRPNPGALPQVFGALSSKRG